MQPDQRRKASVEVDFFTESHIIFLQFNSKLEKGNLESKPKEPIKNPKKLQSGIFPHFFIVSHLPLTFLPKIGFPFFIFSGVDSGF